MARHKGSFKAHDSRIENGQFLTEDTLQCRIDNDNIADYMSERHPFPIVVVSLGNDIIVRQRHGEQIVDIALDVTMSLRPELRGQQVHWYAYKRVMGKLRKLYLGHFEDINTEKIVALAKKFNGFQF